MKPFKEVELTRKLYHAKPTVNSVHRSSLLVPELPGAVAEISFVNHFLLKRKYPHVALRVTAIGLKGERIESRLFPITEPRVYAFTLTGAFDEPASGYMAEFFAADNLFIPFPAVMVNHRGPGFLNTVHSYNRTLNDVFEDDAINASNKPEASVDVLAGLETFLLFAAGPLPCSGSLEIELLSGGQARRRTIPLDVPRLTHLKLRLREIFPDLPKGASGVLKVRQPNQPLFYGRLLVGHEDAAGRFTANHSYYDSSDTKEYWEDGRASHRSYPYFQGLDNRVRMYPIMSPGELAISVSLHGAGGALLGRTEAGSLTSPGSAYLDASVADLAKKAGVAESLVEAFTVEAAGAAMPTRVNHQFVHSRGGLESSINFSLVNPNVFAPPNKTGLTWGQLPVGRGLRSRLGFTGNSPRGEADAVEVTFYGETGELGSVSRPLPAGGSARIDSTELDASWAETRSETPRYLWYIARCARPDLTAVVVTEDLSSGHCTGEHGF